MISLATSLINDKVRDNVKQCLDENRIGTGRFVKEFEQKVAKYIGTTYAIACNNGTMADMVALAALKQYRPDKNEVIVPALTFTAQVAAILFNGLKPVFVDVNSFDNYNNNYPYQINVKQVEQKINKNTLCVMGVHLLGREFDTKSIYELCAQKDILWMEDCCEAYGGIYEHNPDKKFGSLSQFGTFSFFPSHTITTGEGGMITTSNKELADLARKVINHGRKGDDIFNKFHFDFIGYNGKMSNLTASVGCAVADTAEEVIGKRIANVNYFNKLTKYDWYASSPHCYPIVCCNEKTRDGKLQRLHNAGIEARKLFSSLPTQEKAYEHLGYKLGDFPMAEKIGRQGMFVPVHQDLTNEDIEKICSIIK